MSSKPGKSDRMLISKIVNGNYSQSSAMSSRNEEKSFCGDGLQLENTSSGDGSYESHFSEYAKQDYNYDINSDDTVDP